MKRLTVFTACFGLLAAACGGATAPTAPAFPTVSAATPAAAASRETADEAMARLYALAKAEGRVAIYSSMNNDDGKKVFGAFEAKFPGLKVDHTRASGEDLITKIVTEKKAGQDLFDVVESNLFEVAFIIDQKYTQPYTVASVADFPDQVKGKDGAYIGVRMNNDLPGINTQKIYPASCMLAEIVGFTPQPNKAIVGRNAFAHEAGIHQHGVIANPLCYEIMTPESVGVPGNNLVLGKHSGRHALSKRLAELGYKASGPELDSVYKRFMQLAESKKKIYDQDLLSLVPMATRQRAVAHATS